MFKQDAILGVRETKLRICGTIRLIGSNYNKNGILEQVFDRTVNNLITDDGFDLICDVLGLNAQPSDITHMAIGSGTGQGTGDTTLSSEDQRGTAVYAHTGGAKTCTFTKTFSTVVAATEYGLFNDASAGDMFNVADFNAITVDSLQIVATITFSDVG
ncbi:MAG: hypothetical protein E3J83_03545 [Candidatus Atribacteria bacterium]|nr:MAG: hypothetical protein E3J83_03545 [Candidatus Atribacteria bacterium]